jgi:hypothetical protein
MRLLAASCLAKEQGGNFFHSKDEGVVGGLEVCTSEEPGVPLLRLVISIVMVY